MVQLCFCFFLSNWDGVAPFVIITHKFNKKKNKNQKENAFSCRHVLQLFRHFFKRGRLHAGRQGVFLPHADMQMIQNTSVPHLFVSFPRHWAGWREQPEAKRNTVSYLPLISCPSHRDANGTALRNGAICWVLSKCYFHRHYRLPSLIY